MNLVVHSIVEITIVILFLILYTHTFLIIFKQNYLILLKFLLEKNIKFLHFFKKLKINNIKYNIKWNRFMKAKKSNSDTKSQVNKIYFYYKNRTT